MPGIPRLTRHGGTRGLSSTVSLNSFNSTNNIKNDSISNNNNNNNSTKNITGSPITKPNINDTNDNIIDTQREENSPHAPIRRTLRTRATNKKQETSSQTEHYSIQDLL
jgi:hypothetical protein